MSCFDQRRVCVGFSICGTLHSVDQYLNIKLTDISVTDPDKYPHMVSELLNCKKVIVTYHICLVM
jgi:small nuclear ribonucleoprotein (snRNP)-like protein